MCLSHTSENQIIYNEEQTDLVTQINNLIQDRINEYNN